MAQAALRGRPEVQGAPLTRRRRYRDDRVCPGQPCLETHRGGGLPGHSLPDGQWPAQREGTRYCPAGGLSEGREEKPVPGSRRGHQCRQFHGRQRFVHQGGFCRGGEQPSVRAARQEIQGHRAESSFHRRPGASFEATREGPHDPGGRSVPLCRQLGGADCASGPGPGAEAETGSPPERRSLPGPSDALWCVQYYLRRKAAGGASDQRNAIHEPPAHAAEGPAAGAVSCRLRTVAWMAASNPGARARSC